MKVSILAYLLLTNNAILVDKDEETYKGEIIRLPGLSANIGSVTTSGCSSGGYMAQEMHIIYSKQIKGSSSIGSGVYMMGKAENWYEKEKKLTQMAVDYTD